MLNFSQRIGKKPASKELQIESMDKDLKNGLWNVVKKFIILDNPYFQNSYIITYHDFGVLFNFFWKDYLKKTIDTAPTDLSEQNYKIKYYFFKGEWNEVFDIIEFIAQNFRLRNFVDEVNEILEKEFSAYRFIDDIIAPISNTSEVEEIDNAIVTTNRFTALEGANIHLKDALTFLSDREKPHYRNSIKESISAVEATANAIAGTSKDTLGKALSKLKNKINLHPALELGFKQIYGYTSDADGIRHFLMEDSKCDFEDAKYMLVSCSAFINYLIVKAQKAGIQIK